MHLFIHILAGLIISNVCDFSKLSIKFKISSNINNLVKQNEFAQTSEYSIMKKEFLSFYEDFSVVKVLFHISMSMSFCIDFLCLPKQLSINSRCYCGTPLITKAINSQMDYNCDCCCKKISKESNAYYQCPQHNTADCIVLISRNICYRVCSKCFNTSDDEFKDDYKTDDPDGENEFKRRKFFSSIQIIS